MTISNNFASGIIAKKFSRKIAVSLNFKKWATKPNGININNTLNHDAFIILNKTTCAWVHG